MAGRTLCVMEKIPGTSEPPCPALSFSLRIPNFQVVAVRVAVDLAAQSWPGRIVRRYRGGWIYVRDVRKSGADQTVVLLEFLTLVFFILIHGGKSGRSLGSMHGVDYLSQARKFRGQAVQFRKRRLRMIADTVSGLHGIEQRIRRPGGGPGGIQDVICLAQARQFARNAVEDGAIVRQLGIDSQFHGNGVAGVESARGNYGR